MTNEIRKPDATTLEAVYNANKHAKKYSRLADENYRAGKGATAKANSLKKKALYGLKTRAINRFLLDGKDDLEAVERHEINGQPFLCLRFVDENGRLWSYHQPENDVHKSRLPAITDGGELAEFESAEEKEHSNMPLKTALLHLESHGLNANSYLEHTHVSYGRDSHFAGWSYLGDGGVRQ